MSTHSTQPAKKPSLAKNLFMGAVIGGIGAMTHGAAHDAFLAVGAIALVLAVATKLYRRKPKGPQA